MPSSRLKYDLRRLSVQLVSLAQWLARGSHTVMVLGSNPRAGSYLFALLQIVGSLFLWATTPGAAMSWTARQYSVAEAESICLGIYNADIA